MGNEPGPEGRVRDEEPEQTQREIEASRSHPAPEFTVTRIWYRDAHPGNIAMPERMSSMP
jgi:hypothetical protein